MAVTVRASRRALGRITRAVAPRIRLRSAAAGNVFDRVSRAGHLKGEREHHGAKREECHTPGEMNKTVHARRTCSVRCQRHDRYATSLLQLVK